MLKYQITRMKDADMDKSKTTLNTHRPKQKDILLMKVYQLLYLPLWT